MTKFFDAAREHLGRRGLVLLLLSVTFFFFGLKSYFNPLLDTGDFIQYALLPSWLRGTLWVGAAAIGVFAATFRRGRNDGIGFTALSIPPALVGTSYLVSYVAYLFGLTNFNIGWVDALQWYIIVAFLMVTSGWAEVENDVEIIKLVDKKED